MDKEAPDNVLEVTARAITYYLDVSVDCTRRITAVDSALKAIITRMKTSDMSSRTSKDLAEQCVKVKKGIARVLVCLYLCWNTVMLLVWSLNMSSSFQPYS